MKKEVLHIAAHMGGGVGKVLSNVALQDEKYTHRIALLEKPMDTCFTSRLDGDTLAIEPGADDLAEMAREADIVQFDWWNHPLLAGVMYRLRDVPMRSVVWAHNSGCYHPYIKPEFVAMPDHFIFSSRYSLENPYWNIPLPKGKWSVINSSGGFANTQDVPLVPHDGFNVGYVGTLGYMKLLPEFVDWCKAISDIPRIRFVMIGRIPNPNQILLDAERAGIADRFVFKGYVDDLPAEMAQLDVLGYLLNPHHHGTTENALLEAMSMGIPPVCINQCAEKHLVQDYISGVLVKDKREYRRAMMQLNGNQPLRENLGATARNHVLSSFNIGNTLEKLAAVYGTVAKKRRRKVDVAKVFGNTPYEWYKAGLPPSGTSGFTDYLTDATKGSVMQWRKYYPEGFP